MPIIIENNNSFNSEREVIIEKNDSIEKTIDKSNKNSKLFEDIYDIFTELFESNKS